VKWIPIELAVHAIRRWWKIMGRKRHPDARKFVISADGGGSRRRSEAFAFLGFTHYCGTTGMAGS
jgi:Rhodopirellula transposase DDE domain